MVLNHGQQNQSVAALYDEVFSLKAVVILLLHVVSINFLFSRPFFSFFSFFKSKFFLLAKSISLFGALNYLPPLILFPSFWLFLFLFLDALDTGYRA